MTATPARIGFITQQFRRAISETPAAQTRHGDLARESADPIETFFDDVDDAQLVADDRQALLSEERRRFSPVVRGIDEALALPYTTGLLPVARYVDDERGIDTPMLITEIEIDFSSQQAKLPVWG